MEINNRGYFKGYASVFNSPDLTNDIVVPGAFGTSLLRRGISRIKMLYQHDASQVIGSWHKIEEDTHGLYVEGSLLLEIQRAVEIFALLKERALDGLSIGFRTVRASPSRLNYRIVEEIDLAEISIVTFPMHPDARVGDVIQRNVLKNEHPNLSLVGGLQQAALNLNRITANEI